MEVLRNWHHIDAKKQILGRLATRVAGLLMGKHKLGVVHYADKGDFVIVTNVEKVAVTGNKEVKNQKIYQNYSGHPGGLKKTSISQMRATHPERILRTAVLRMLPSNKLRAGMIKRLKLIVGDVNPYADKLGTDKKKTS